MVTISQRMLFVAVTAVSTGTASMSVAGPPATRCLSVLRDGNGSVTDNAPLTPIVSAREAKPEDDSLRVELADILRQWEQATAGVTRLDCRFKRYKYDHVFEVEYRSEGALAVDREGRAAYSFEPVVVQRGAFSRQRNQVDKPYAVRPDMRERWCWTGAETLKIDESSKIFERIVFANAPVRHSDRPQPPALPEDPKPSFVRTNSTKWVWPDLSGWYDGFRELFIPRSFLLGPRVDELECEFRIELVKQTPTQVWLSFQPRVPNKSLLFREAKLILNLDDWTLYALKIVEPSGNSDTIHVFSDVQFNRTDPHAPDLANPDLREYHPLQR